MNRVAVAFLAILLLQLPVVPADLHARLKPAQRSRTSRVVVHHLPDSAGRVATSGWVMAMTDSTLLLDAGDRFLTLARQEIRSIELRIPPHREFGLLGITAGAWLMNYVVIRHSNSLENSSRHSRSTFLPKGDEHNVHTLLFLACAGAVPGGLLGMVADRLVVEEVRHYRADRDDEWSSLREELERVKRPWEVNVVTGMRVWSGGEEQLDDRHAAAGVNRTAEPIDYGPVQWLRRGSVHVGLTHTLGLGLTYVDLTTPTRISSLNLHADSSAVDNPDRRHMIESTVSLDGYAASVILRPFDHLPDRLDVRLGGGAGVAVGVFDEDIEPLWWNDTDGLQSSRTTEVIVPFGMLTADVTGYLTEGLSIGLSGDVALLLPFDMPALTGVSGTEYAWFSSASVGVVVGYRF